MKFGKKHGGSGRKKGRVMIANLGLEEVAEEFSKDTHTQKGKKVERARERKR